MHIMRKWKYSLRLSLFFSFSLFLSIALQPFLLADSFILRVFDSTYTWFIQPLNSYICELAHSHEQSLSSTRAENFIAGVTHHSNREQTYNMKNTYIDRISRIQKYLLILTSSAVHIIPTQSSQLNTIIT